MARFSSRGFGRARRHARIPESSEGAEEEAEEAEEEGGGGAGGSKRAKEKGRSGARPVEELNERCTTALHYCRGQNRSGKNESIGGVFR